MKRFVVWMLCICMVLPIVIVCATPAVAATGEDSLDDHLILYSSFDASSAADDSGNGHHGTVHGNMQYGEGVSGNALYITGQSNPGAMSAASIYVDYGASSAIIPDTGDFSFSLFYRYMGTTPAWGVLLSNKDYAYKDNRGFTLDAQNGSDQQEFTVHNAPKLISSEDIYDGEWHQLTCTLDRDGKMVYYVDGGEVGSISLSDTDGSMNNGNWSLVVGADSRRKYWGIDNCMIDELRIYDKALSDAEVLDQYADITDQNPEDLIGSVLEKRLGIMLERVKNLTPSPVYPQDKIDEVTASIELLLLQLPSLDTEQGFARFEACELAVEQLEKGVKPLASFHFIADVHVTTSGDMLARALKGMSKINTDTNIGLIIAGDNTDDGTEAQYKIFYDTLQANNPLSPDRVSIVMGNHDTKDGGAWHDSPAELTEETDNFEIIEERFLRYNGQYMPDGSDKVYYAKELGGYTFIMLNTEMGSALPGTYLSSEQLAWLEKTMADAYAKDPLKPIFIVNHQPLLDTHYISNDWGTLYLEGHAKEHQGLSGVTDAEVFAMEVAANNEVKKILDKYPTSVWLSGHEHNIFGRLVSVIRHHGAAVEAPSLKYFNPGCGWEAQIYDNAIVFRAIDFTTGEYKPQYDIMVQTAENNVSAIYQQAQNVLKDPKAYCSDKTASIRSLSEDLLELMDVYEQAGQPGFYTAGHHARINSVAQELKTVLASVKQHQTAYPCSSVCTLCGDDVTPEPHVGEVACRDTVCKYGCGTSGLTPVACVGEIPCKDTVCRYCGGAATPVACVGEIPCKDTTCRYCGEDSATPTAHTFAHLCALLCELCGEANPSPAQHELGADSSIFCKYGCGTVVTDDVASLTVGGATTYYKTLQAAIEAANAAGGGTVTLLADAELNESVALTASIKIYGKRPDGGNYKITADFGSAATILFTAQDASVTLTLQYVDLTVNTTNASAGIFKGYANITVENSNLVSAKRGIEINSGDGIVQFTNSTLTTKQGNALIAYSGGNRQFILSNSTFTSTQGYTIELNGGTNDVQILNGSKVESTTTYTVYLNAGSTNVLVSESQVSGWSAFYGTSGTNHTIRVEKGSTLTGSHQAILTRNGGNYITSIVIDSSTVVSGDGAFELYGPSKTDITIKGTATQKSKIVAKKWGIYTASNGKLDVTNAVIATASDVSIWSAATDNTVILGTGAVVSRDHSLLREYSLTATDGAAIRCNNANGTFGITLKGDAVVSGKNDKAIWISQAANYSVTFENYTGTDIIASEKAFASTGANNMYFCGYHLATAIEKAGAGGTVITCNQQTAAAIRAQLYAVTLANGVYTVGAKLDVSAMDQAIANANAAKDGVAVHTHACQAGKDNRYVLSEDVITALTNAITAAQAARNADAADQQALDAAVGVLNAALATFEGSVKTGVAHEGEKDCSTTCKVCGTDITPKVAHEGEYDCSVTCKQCGAVIAQKSAHVGEKDCSATCQWCNTAITPKSAHVGQYDCSTNCKWCGTTIAQKSAHVGEKDCSTSCKWCGTAITGAAHVGEKDCSATCKWCGTAITPKSAHVGQYDCSANCKDCGAVITPQKAHEGEKNCSTVCKYCHETGKFTPSAKHMVNTPCTDEQCSTCQEAVVKESHAGAKDCSATCQWCNTAITPKKAHEGAKACSTVCKYGCGTSVTGAAHVGLRDCSKVCKYGCGTSVTPKAEHTGEFDCSTKCKYGCGTTISSAKDHDGQYACSMTCQYGCGTEITDAKTCVGAVACVDTTCQWCGAAVTPIAHDVVTDAAKAPTCTETGLTEGAHCARCNTVTTAQQTVAATGHKYDNDADASCNTCGTERTVENANGNENTANGNENNAQNGNTEAPAKQGLSGGAVAGIVIAAVVVLGGGGFALFWFVIKKKKA